MKDYYIELERNNEKQAKEVIELAKKLGYKPEEAWNDYLFEINKFNCIYLYSKSRSCAVHYHDRKVLSNFEPITINELKKLAEQ